MNANHPLLLVLLAACGGEAKNGPADPTDSGADPTGTDSGADTTGTDSDPGDSDSAPVPEPQAPSITCQPEYEVEMSGEPGVTLSVTDDTPVTTVRVSLSLDGGTPYVTSPAADGSVYFPIPAPQRTVDATHIYSLRVEATDEHHLTGYAACAFVGVDQQPPTVEIDSPAPGEEVWDEAEVSARVSDDFAAVRDLEVQIVVDGLLEWSGPPDATGVVTWSAGARALRTYPFDVIVTDPSGNTATASSTWDQTIGTGIATPRNGDTYSFGEMIIFEVGSDRLDTVTEARWTATSPSESYFFLESRIPEALRFLTSLSERGEYLIELSWVNGAESGTDTATIEVL